MKKLFKKILGLTAAAAIAVSAVPASAAETTLIYANAFSRASSINDLTLVGAGKLEGKPTMAFDRARGSMYFEGWGQNCGFLLPEDVTASDFVMEADVAYEKKPGTEEEGGYRGRTIGYGFIFGYQDENNFSDIVYYPLNGNVTMHNTIDGNMQGRNAEKGSGASFDMPENETAHIKLIVNSGLMEFFVNDELCYTYYSDAQNASGNNQQSRDFTEGGRLGLFCNADRTYLTYKNLMIRTVDDREKAYYANAYMGPAGQFDDMIMPMSDVNPFFKADSVTGGSWGVLDYNGANWDNTGRYINIPLSGNYVADINFALVNPLNTSRFFGLGIGGKTEADGGYTYTAAVVSANGNMTIEQKTVTAAGSESTISGAQAAYNSCRNTLPADKTNPNVDTGAPQADQYLLSYMPDGYNSQDPADVNSRRHNLHLEVVNGEISITFEGTTLRLTPDVNTTDGYLSIRSAGTKAKIYSLRVAPYAETPLIEIPETTMNVDYSELSDEYAAVDIKVDDGENIVTDTARVMLAVYNEDGSLAGIDVQEVDPELNYLEVELDGNTNVTSRVLLWDMNGMEALLDALPITF